MQTTPLTSATKRIIAVSAVSILVVVLSVVTLVLVNKEKPSTSSGTTSILPGYEVALPTNWKEAPSEIAKNLGSQQVTTNDAYLYDSSEVSGSQVAAIQADASKLLTDGGVLRVQVFDRDPTKPAEQQATVERDVTTLGVYRGGFSNGSVYGSVVIGDELLVANLVSNDGKRQISYLGKARNATERAQMLSIIQATK